MVFRLIKRTVPVLILASVLFFAGCSGGNGSNQAPPDNNNNNDSENLPKPPASLSVSGITELTAEYPDLNIIITNNGQGSATNVKIEPLTEPLSITSNTCVSVLAPNASCIVSVIFNDNSKPKKDGPGIFQITYSDLTNQNYNSVNSIPYTFSEEPPPTTPANLAFMPGTLTFDTVVGNSVRQTANLKNGGDNSASIVAIKFDKALSFLTVDNSGDGACSKDDNLAQTSSCSVTVFFNPTQAVSDSAILEVDYKDAITNEIRPAYLFISYRTTEIPPPPLPSNLIFTPRTLTFEILAGNSSRQTANLQNRGDTSASIVNIKLADDLPFLTIDRSGDGSCKNGNKLAKLELCSVTLLFNPTEATDSGSTTLEVDYEDALTGEIRPEYLSISYQAAALPPPPTPANLAFTPRELTFDTVIGTGVRRTANLQNGGDNSASITDIKFNSSVPFLTIDSSGGGVCKKTSNLGKSGSCSVTILFNPTETVSGSAILEVDYKDAITNEIRPEYLSISYSTTSIPPPLLPSNLTFTPKTLNFDILAGNSSRQTANLQNGGDNSASITDIKFNSSAPFLTIDDSGNESCKKNDKLEKLELCSITLLFNPTAATEGSTTLEVNYKDAVTGEIRPEYLSISYKATAPPPPPSPANLAFVPREIVFETLTGNSVRQTSNLQNGGDNYASITDIKLNNTLPFLTIDSNGNGACKKSDRLAKSALCSITVLFNPTEATSGSAILEVDYQDGETGNIRPEYLSISYQATEPPVVGKMELLVAPVTSVKFEASAGGYFQQTYTLTNVGEKAGKITNIQFANGNTIENAFAFHPGSSLDCLGRPQLAKNATCEFIVSFQPRSGQEPTGGALSHAIDVSCEDVAGVCKHIALSYEIKGSSNPPPPPDDGDDEGENPTPPGQGQLGNRIKGLYNVSKLKKAFPGIGYDFEKELSPRICLADPKATFVGSCRYPNPFGSGEIAGCEFRGGANGSGCGAAPGDDSSQCRTDVSQFSSMPWLINKNVTVNNIIMKSGSWLSGEDGHWKGTIRLGDCGVQNTYLGWIGGMDNTTSHWASKIMGGVGLEYDVAIENQLIRNQIVIRKIANNPGSLTPPTEKRSNWFTGYNIAGFEFSAFPNNSTIPNISGTTFPYQAEPGEGENLIYNTKPNKVLTEFVNQGANTVRVPLRWEFLQPYGKDDVDDTAFSAFFNSLVVPTLQILTNKQVYAIIDLHSYMHYSIVGKEFAGCDESDMPCPNGTVVYETEPYVKIWKKIWQTIKNPTNGINTDYIMFDLVNEPATTETNGKLDDQNPVCPGDALKMQAAVIKALIDDGFTKNILVEGAYWSGLHSWVSMDESSEKSTALCLNRPDPALKFNGGAFARSSFKKALQDAGLTSQNADQALKQVVINVHQYLDPNGSGFSEDGTCKGGIMNHTEKLTAFVDWLRVNKYRAMVTEFGANPKKWNGNCEPALNEFLKFMAQNAYSSSEDSGFIGWTAWGYSPSWAREDSYPLRLVPDNNVGKTLACYFSQSKKGSLCSAQMQVQNKKKNSSKSTQNKEAFTKQHVEKL